jgi:L-lactate dehydrogenase (cytochrome)
LARQRLPRPVFDYLDGGADGEITLRENCRVFDDVTFRPRYAVPVSDCDLRTRVLGFDISFPAILAPVGYSRLMHPDGEAGAARAAGAAGTAYILSTISGHRVEDVKAASTGPVCFQLYLMGGREASEAVIDRARVAGCAALVVTIDTPVAGMRERDFRNGTKELMGGSLVSKVPFLPQMLARPAWIVSYLLDGGLSKLPNVVVPGKGPMELVDVGAALARSAVTWDDLTWMRKHWPISRVRFSAAIFALAIILCWKASSHPVCSSCAAAECDSRARRPMAASRCWRWSARARTSTPYRCSTITPARLPRAR